MTFAPDQSERPLSEWRRDLRENKKLFPTFFRERLGTACSDPVKLYAALKHYGFWPVFEAIIDSSAQTLTGDPLNYVLKVAFNKWKEEEMGEDKDYIYNQEIQEAKKRSAKVIKDMTKRLKRAEERSSHLL